MCCSRQRAFDVLNQAFWELVWCPRQGARSVRTYHRTFHNTNFRCGGKKKGIGNFRSVLVERPGASPALPEHLERCRRARFVVGFSPIAWRHVSFFFIARGDWVGGGGCPPFFNSFPSALGWLPAPGSTAWQGNPHRTISSGSLYAGQRAEPGSPERIRFS
jgi:hypothetical protein